MHYAKLFSACVGLILAVAAADSSALEPASNQKTPHLGPSVSRIVGVWALDSIYENDAGGEDIDQFDPEPQGEMAFDRDGHFYFAIFGSTSNYRSGDRLNGTHLEIEAAANLNLSYYGTYQVDDETGVLTLRIARSSFPNWNGSVRTASIATTGDRLEFISSGYNTLTGAFYSRTTWTRTK
jgi:hypothetical protein